MRPFEEQLQEDLADIEASGLRRQLRTVGSPQGVRVRIDGQEVLNFASNDYLGLANHPLLRQAAVEAVQQHGAGAGASRLICGSMSIHHALEESLANFKQTAAALCFSTGYATAVGTICSLVGKGDVVIIDKLAHASIVDGARLSGARLRVFRHNDLNDLEQKLRWADTRASSGRVLVITESVFSMDGDLAPLRELVAVKERFGAWLMLDEAHATGVFGENGCGLAQHAGVSDQVEVQMGTLGKALGAAGGYVCGSRSLIDLLVNRARSFIFSTAPVPAAVAAARAGVTLAGSPEGEQRRERLWKCVSGLATVLGKHTSVQLAAQSPIIPWILGDESSATQTANLLRKAGVYAPAIRYPTVSRGSARLRFTVTADHTEEDLSKLNQALQASELP